MMTSGFEEANMSRNDSRRGNKRRNSWNDRENLVDGGRNFNKKNERSSRNERSERNEHRARSNLKNERRSVDLRNNEKHSEARRQFSNFVSQKEIQEHENAIKEFKKNVPICEICGQPITDITSAISNKNDGNPVHFDCVLNKISESEKFGPNERIAYIGQGRFAVISTENSRDSKHFTIKKTIEWEDRERERDSWRNEISSLYSQVK